MGSRNIFRVRPVSNVGWALVLLVNIRLALKNLRGGKHSSLLACIVSEEGRSLKTLTTGPNVLKRFTTVIYEFLQ
jgi:hypothetical protein